MEIKTRFGVAHNVEINEWHAGNHSYSLGYIYNNGSDGEYDLLGFDVPTKDDPFWRFWVESGDCGSANETNDAELSSDDKEMIKKMFYEWAKHNIPNEFSAFAISIFVEDAPGYSVFVEARDSNEAVKIMTDQHLYEEAEDLYNIDGVWKLTIEEYFNEYLCAKDA